MNSLKNNINVGIKAVKSLQSAIDSLHDKTVMVNVKVNNPSGVHVGAALKTQHGFHGFVDKPGQMFLAGEAGRERVDITPVSKMSQSSGGVGGSGGGDTYVNIDLLSDKYLYKISANSGRNRYRFGLG